MPTLEYLFKEEKKNYLKNPPKNAHRYNPTNLPGYVTRDYIKFCPNNQKTILPDGTISMMGGAGMDKPKYTEYTQCPDCGCQVIRKPTQERIIALKERRKKSMIRINDNYKMRVLHNKRYVEG